MLAVTFFGLAHASGDLESLYSGACRTDEGSSVHGEYYCLGGADGCSDGGTLSTDSDGFQSCDTGIVMCTAGSVDMSACEDACVDIGCAAVSASDEFCQIHRTNPSTPSSYVNKCYSYDSTDFTLVGDGMCRPSSGTTTNAAGVTSLAGCQQACVDDGNCNGLFWSTYSGAGASEDNSYSATQCQLHTATPTSVSASTCYTYVDSDKSPLGIITIALGVLAAFGLYACAYWTGRPKIMAMQSAQVEKSMETKGVVTSSQYEDEKAEMA